jgi:glycosyltransferase involved in cell wall biosynthesis
MFVGHTDQAHRYYEGSDVFVYASPKEGFGMVIAEAQASGLPVICYDCLAGPRDIVCDGESGILIPLGDVGAFADAMRQLAFNDELRLTMSKKASRVFERLGVQALMPTWGNAFNATKPGQVKPSTQY